MTDTNDCNAENHRQKLRQRLLASRLLGEHDQQTVTMEYDGYGDSGGVQDCSLPDDELIEFLWEFVEEFHGGFYNGSGGNGTITWDLVNDTITIDHNDIVEERENTITVIGPDGASRQQEISEKDRIRMTIRSCQPLRLFLLDIANNADAATAARLREVF